MEAWISDLEKLEYKPPILQNISPHKSDIKTATKTAICLTGQLDRISKAWPPTQTMLEIIFASVKKEYDLFYYVSRYNSKNSEDEKFLKTMIQPAIGIIYDDPTLKPKNFKNEFGGFILSCAIISFREKITLKFLFTRFLE